MEDNLNILVNGRQPQCYSNEDKLKILVNGKQAPKNCDLKQLQLKQRLWHRSAKPSFETLMVIFLNYPVIIFSEISFE
jgi:hypothetical protein